jgi:hypothetical protein
VEKQSPPKLLFRVATLPTLPRHSNKDLELDSQRHLDLARAADSFIHYS